MSGCLRARGAAARILLGLGAYPACVFYVPTDEFRRPSTADAAADAASTTDGGPSDSTYSNVVLGDSPIAYWRLEESGGDVAHDETGHGHDATYVGTFTFGADGVLGAENDHAVDFDGRSAYLAIADAAPFAFNGSAPCSVEAWVKTRPSQNEYRKIFMQAARSQGVNPRAGWILSLPTTDKGTVVEYDRLRAPNSENLLAGVVPENTWTHVVLTYGGAMGTIYLDGVSVGSKSLPMTLDPNGAGLVIGGNTDPNEPSYSGQMDELAVYDHELTAAQVLAHFRAARGGTR